MIRRIYILRVLVPRTQIEIIALEKYKNTDLKKLY